MPSSEPKECTDSTQPASIAGISAGCGLSAQCRQILPFRPERLGVGRQQQLDRRGVEADAVVQALHAVLGVDALDRHHRHQHLDLGDLRRVAREQRLDEVRASAPAITKSTQSAGMSTRGSVSTHLVDLRDHDAAAERGGLDDRRRVLGVGAGVEVAGGVGGLRRDQRDARRQVDEVAARTARGRCGSRRSRCGRCRHELREPRALRPGEREVELRRDAALEHVEVLGQRQHRLHHVQVVHARRVDARPARRPGSRPASGCCLRGRRGRPARCTASSSVDRIGVRRRACLAVARRALGRAREPLLAVARATFQSLLTSTVHRRLSSVELDVAGLDHLGPALRLGGDEVAEGLAGQRRRLGAEAGPGVLDLLASRRPSAARRSCARSTSLAACPSAPTGRTRWRPGSRARRLRRWWECRESPARACRSPPRSPSAGRS